MSYRLSLLRLQLSSLKASVTHQKCTIISNFDFDPLRVELAFLTKQTQRTIVMCANRNKTIFICHSPTLRKGIDIHCKVTFGFKCIMDKLGLAGDVTTLEFLLCRERF